MRVLFKSQRGFSLIEVMIAGGISMIAGLGMATLQSNQSKGLSLLNSQNSKTTLSSALRTQLSRRESCLPSFKTPPTNWGGDNNVGVAIGNNLATDLVQGGLELKQWSLTIDSLRVNNLAAEGTTSSGALIYIGDLVLKTSSRQLASVSSNKFGFAEQKVARIVFEVTGGNMTACYAQSADTDITSNFQTVCELTRSSRDPAAQGHWVGDHCVMDEPSAAIECQTIGGTMDNGHCVNPSDFSCQKVGGTWDSGTGSCVFPPNVSCGKMGGTWDGSTCTWPAASCAKMGGSWATDHCNWPPPSGQDNCTAMGGSWAGGACQFPSSGGGGSDPATMCGQMGGSWNGACSFGGGGGPAQTPAQQCAGLGGSWTGSKCDFGGSGGQSNQSCPDEQYMDSPAGPHAHGSTWSRAGGGFDQCAYTCINGVPVRGSCTSSGGGSNDGGGDGGN